MARVTEADEDDDDDDSQNSRSPCSLDSRCVPVCCESTLLQMRLLASLDETAADDVAAGNDDDDDDDDDAAALERARFRGGGSTARM